MLEPLFDKVAGVLRIKTPERRQSRSPGVFIVNRLRTLLKRDCNPFVFL